MTIQALAFRAADNLARMAKAGETRAVMTQWGRVAQ